MDGEFQTGNQKWTTDADRQMMTSGLGQLIGQFLLDRDGVVCWTFTEAAEDGRQMFGAPKVDELMSAVMHISR